ncbi:hypothetical protein T492DRAFT_1001778 [Pavlovales sp. CCMP2436]|nr:hypothetical protein T492DRAFT_1001778 [Pavlovales sp. CCMP2436]
MAAGSSFTWDERYDQLVAYNSKHGCYNVPDHDGGLGTWLMNQRQGRRKQTGITREHIEKLNALPGFEWDVREATWSRMVEQLKLYAGQHSGSRDVPEGWPDNPQLAKWVSRQRQEAKALKEGKKAKIDHERISVLDDIGTTFTWGSFAGAAWDAKYEELGTYIGLGKALVHLVPQDVARPGVLPRNLAQRPAMCCSRILRAR